MIEVDKLTKDYRGLRAVDNVSFRCEPGTVTGFLGPNGAGKSTTLRILTGLTPATSGSATIGGVRFSDIPNPGTQVGVLLDASAQHAGRTGREVLAVGAATMGLPPSRVDDMLNLVSLTPSEAKRRVRNYSLGMRQRLGLAHSLLGEPQVLILDEPANGLDPAGIHWMRSLLRTYADRGGTVLLSSHLLHEIQIIADDLVVIGNGRIVAQGPKEELLKGENAGTFARSTDGAALAKALADSGLKAEPEGDGFQIEAGPEAVAKAAADAGIVLVEIRESSRGGLEEMFLELTAPTQRDALPTYGASS